MTTPLISLTPSLASSQAKTTAQTGEGEDEDGRELAELLKMQDRLRRQASEGHSTAQLQPQPDQQSEVISEVGEESQSSGHSSQQLKARIEVASADRRAKAIAYLESIPLSFLGQISSSLRTVHARDVSLRQKAVKGKVKTCTPAESQPNGPGEAGRVEEKFGISLSLRNRQTGQDQITSFPDNPLSSEAREPALHRMACIMRVASLLVEAIVTEITTTKRDIYYKDVALFKTQSVVDKLVDDIVATAGLKRQDFNVTATSKGLIASSALEICLKSGSKLSFSSSNASLIPPIERIGEVAAPRGLDWVLIVEKDAVFQTLCSGGLLDDDRLRRGALITGKGYPDLATLQLVHRIAKDFPNAKICVLVDADPHGLDILSVYTYGSKATIFSHDYVDLALGDRINWIGVTTEDWKAYRVPYERLLPLTDNDVQKVGFRSWCKSADVRQCQCCAMRTFRARGGNIRTGGAYKRRELACMLHLNRKAEIQILSGIAPMDVEMGRELQDGAELRSGRSNMLVEHVVKRLQTFT